MVYHDGHKWAFSWWGSRQLPFFFGLAGDHNGGRNWTPGDGNPYSYLTKTAIDGRLKRTSP